MNSEIYLHQFQKPTFEQIISEGCKAIDTAVEKVISKYEAPQISPNPYFVGYLDHAFSGPFMYELARQQSLTRNSLSGNQYEELSEWQKRRLAKQQQSAFNALIGPTSCLLGYALSQRP